MGPYQLQPVRDRVDLEVITVNELPHPNSFFRTGASLTHSVYNHTQDTFFLVGGRSSTSAGDRVDVF